MNRSIQIANQFVERVFVYLSLLLPVADSPRMGAQAMCGSRQNQPIQQNQNPGIRA